MTGDWQSAFVDLDRSAWPGPRPLDHRHQLCGRESDRRRFAVAVRDHLLTTLTADSGVGKSSLLRGGLLPELEADGYEYVLVDDWKVSANARPQDVVAAALADRLAGHPEAEGLDFTRDAIWTSQQLGARPIARRLVIVLDQFEELIRFRHTTYRQAEDWIIELNRHTAIRVVISLRSEFHHHLRMLEREVRPFSMTTIRLEPVTDETSLEAIIRSAEQPGRADCLRCNVDDLAIRSIVTQWQAARESPGLIGLQAFLYEMYHRMNGKTDQVQSRPATGALAITPDDVATMSKDLAKRVRSGDASLTAPRTIFDVALVNALDRKLRHCRNAAIEAGYDRVLVEGADALMGRILPRLSSGGFKLVLDETALISSVLAEDTGKRSTTDWQDVVAEVSRFRSSDGSLFREPWPGGIADGEQPHGLEHMLADWVPWRNDPDGGSSGVMLGMSPAAVHLQEARRFEFALAWLQGAQIVRRSTPDDRTRLVALVHDAFGRAFEGRAGDGSERFSHAANRISRARGQSFHWPTEQIEAYRKEAGTDIAGVRCVVIVNARWRDCTISASTFGSVVFVNADLRGSSFENCTFDGTTFLNCLLDNVSFDQCTVRGSLESPFRNMNRADWFRQAKETDAAAGARDYWEQTARGDRALPDFTLDVSLEDADNLAAYRRVAYEGNEAMYSRTSGVSAILVPYSVDPPGMKWSPRGGGLTVLGGRLNSLLFSRCLFPEDGTLSLGHIAGSSLEIAEFKGGRIEVVDGSMRSFSVTCPVGAAPDTPAETELFALESVLSAPFFDRGLTGTARFYGSVLIQPTSLSENEFQIIASTADDLDGRNIVVAPIMSDGDLEDQYDEALAASRGVVSVTEVERDGAEQQPGDLWLLKGPIPAMNYRTSPAQKDLDPTWVES